MQFTLPSHRKEVEFSFTLASDAPQTIRIYAYDRDRPKRIFTDRLAQMSAGQRRNFQLKFPVSPNVLIVNIAPENGGSNSDRSLKVSGEQIKPLKKCLFATLTPHTAQFIKFALEFAFNCMYMGTGVATSANKQFVIHYKDTIRDKGGKQLNTPARIHHVSGVIEVAKDKFSTYSIPMMFLILLHEYSHKWLNRQAGYRMDDEVAADLNALKIYLSLGFPHIDARLVFCKVFYNKETPQNMERLNIIERYITKFEEGKVIPTCK